MAHAPEQLIVWPQLFTALAPPHLPAHGVTLLGTQHVVPSHTLPPGQVAEHATVCPQLFTTCVLHLPLHAVTLSGVQQVVPLQIALPAQAPGHATVCPQLLTTLTLHLPWHGVTLSGTQHAPLSASHKAPGLAQAVVPLGPHGTDCPQLLVAVPQARPPQVAPGESGTQPHELFVHVRPPSQPPQSVAALQLSVVDPHRPLHHPATSVHLQVWVVESHVELAPQSVLHARMRPQLSAVVPQ